MPFFFQPGTQQGSAVDDFMSGEVGGPNHTISGGDGNDLILGDGGPVFTTAGTSHGDPQTLDIDRFWDDFTDNPDVEVTNSLDRYTRIYREAPGGQADWFSVVLSTGQSITIDIDYGSHPTGISLDTVVSIFNQDDPNNPLATNDDADATLGGGGSVSAQDSFLTFTPDVGGRYRIKIGQFDGGPDSLITKGATYIANITVNQHLFDNSFEFGGDLLNGEAGHDIIYGREGDDFVLGGYGDDTVDGGGGNDILVGDRNGGAVPAPVASLTFEIFDLSSREPDNLDSLNQTAPFETGFVRSIDLLDLTGRFPFLFDNSPNNFGVRYQGVISTEAGVHTFSTNSDDGSQLLIDGVVVVDNDRVQPPTFVQNNVTLSAGQHSIEIRYFERSGGETLDVMVRTPGASALTELFASGILQPTSATAFGDDSILGGAGNDQIGGEVGNDTIRGGDDDDAIFGGEDEDMLFGDQGADTLNGGSGSDALFGGSGFDIARFDAARSDFNIALQGDALAVTERATGDTDIVSSDIEAVTFADLNTTFTALRTAVLNPPPPPPPQPTEGDDVLVGDALPNSVRALGGDDNISGLGGSDTLRGQGGDDTIKGGSGDDRLLGNGGSDLIRGQGGDDTLKGGGGDDSLLGNGGSDNLNGGGGDDQLKGNGGGDMLDGRGGNDRLIGGGGSDTLNGRGGADTITGGGGDDRLIGGKGGDQLMGSGGRDTFVFAQGDGSDRLTDFRQGQDRIEFSRGPSDFGDLNISQQGADVRIAYTGGVIIVETDNANAFTSGDFIF